MSELVLVTGGGGFIGTWVLRALLARGLNAVAFDAHENSARWQRLLGERAADVPFVRGSLLDRELLARVFEEHHSILIGERLPLPRECGGRFSSI